MIAMNWVDVGLLALLIAMIVVGSKKGLVRELMAFFTFVAALIFSIRYIDQIAIKVHEKLNGSTMASAFISFILLMAVAYALFKLLGLVFYRIANLQGMGRRDRLGGALVGALRGWVALSLLVFLTFLIPMPDKYFQEFRESALGPTLARTLPALYEVTSVVHPNDTSFMAKVEGMLLYRVDKSGMSPSMREEMDENRRKAYRTIYRLDSVLTR